VVKIGTPNTEARLMYLRSRNLELSEEEIQRWAEASKGFSLAHLKELIIGIVCLGGNLEDEIVRLKAMAQTPKSSDTGRGVGFQRD
jgi:hypothetical protein